MDKYKLIGLDQMEASLVRRRLRQWTKADEQAITSLITALQQKQGLPDVHVTEPCYETNVYPLYYYWAHYRQVRHREVYDCVFRSLPSDRVSMTEEELRSLVARVVDSEIDLMVEDIEYFVFIEAKETPPGHKVKFENKGGVHQLVRQYVQGKILQKLISKTFALATIGANNGEILPVRLNDTERKLLQLVDQDMVTLQVRDISWPPHLKVRTPLAR